MKPKQYFFVLLGIIAALIVAGGFGYYWAMERVKATSTQLSQNLADQAAAQDTLDNLSQLKVQYSREIVPLLPLINEALPSDKNQTEILAQLQYIAGEAGLSLSSVTFPSPVGLPSAVSQTVPAGIALALPVNFQLQGSFDQLQTFLTKVENLSRLTNVTTLSVARPDRTKPIIYTMTLNAYVKP